MTPGMKTSFGIDLGATRCLMKYVIKGIPKMKRKVSFEPKPVNPEWIITSWMIFWKSSFSRCVPLSRECFCMHSNFIIVNNRAS